MNIDATVADYLNGTVISNAGRFSVDRSPVISREHLLVSLTKNKSVIHLGCADHIDLINEKRRSGRYLHDLVTASASRVVGIDTNAAALEQMRRIGITDLYAPGDFKDHGRFDVLLVPDVIEHVPNVAKFLTGLRAYNVEEWIITSPNAFRLANRRLFSQEIINTDHRYWFSPYTLTKVLYESGFAIRGFYYTDQLSYRHPISSYLKWRYPLCRDGLAVTANATPPAEAQPAKEQFA
jgi:hypothetical protein